MQVHCCVRVEALNEVMLLFCDLILDSFSLLWCSIVAKVANLKV